MDPCICAAIQQAIKSTGLLKYDNQVVQMAEAVVCKLEAAGIKPNVCRPAMITKDPQTNTTITKRSCSDQCVQSLRLAQLEQTVQDLRDFANGRSRTPTTACCRVGSTRFQATLDGSEVFLRVQAHRYGTPVQPGSIRVGCYVIDTGCEHLTQVTGNWIYLSALEHFYRAVAVPFASESAAEQWYRQLLSIAVITDGGD
jgi:hypothetical protein